MYHTILRTSIQYIIMFIHFFFIYEHNVRICLLNSFFKFIVRVKIEIFLVLKNSMETRVQQHACLNKCSPLDI